VRTRTPDSETSTTTQSKMQGPNSICARLRTAWRSMWRLFWTEKFGVTKEALMDAVKRAGVSAKAVAADLGKTL
jgi:hypothetical protein